MTAFNGFAYPAFPEDMPELNVISIHLISTQVPFMQIRRLRIETGPYRIVGHIFNVRVDVREMLSSLPQDLADDYAIYVCFKAHDP